MMNKKGKLGWEAIVIIALMLLFLIWYLWWAGALREGIIGAIRSLFRR